jgi:hypothetical protein
VLDHEFLVPAGDVSAGTALRVKSRVPKVMRCGQGACEFNSKGRCGAPGISIEGPVPACATFGASDPQLAGQDSTGAAAACKASTCVFNNMHQCSAMGIEVGKAGSHALCRTFCSEESRLEFPEVHAAL